MKSVKTAVLHESKSITTEEAIDNLGNVNRRYDDFNDLACKLVDYYNEHELLTKKEALILEFGITNAYLALEEAYNLLKANN
jgi:hypothetical protein